VLAHLEVWGGADDHGVVLERQAFQELERAREELTAQLEAVNAQRKATDERLARALEWRGMLSSDLDALHMVREDQADRHLTAEHSVDTLQCVVGGLMHQVEDLDTELGALAEEKRLLQQSLGSTASACPGGSNSHGDSDSQVLLDKLEAERAELRAELHEMKAQREATLQERTSNENESLVHAAAGQAWEAERELLLHQVEEAKREANSSRQAVQAALGQLVLEKQELVAQLKNLKSGAPSTRSPAGAYKLSRAG